MQYYFENKWAILYFINIFIVLCWHHFQWKDKQKTLYESNKLLTLFNYVRKCLWIRFAWLTPLCRLSIHALILANTLGFPRNSHMLLAYTVECSALKIMCVVFTFRLQNTRIPLNFDLSGKVVCAHFIDVMILHT